MCRAEILPRYREVEDSHLVFYRLKREHHTFFYGIHLLPICPSYQASNRCHHNQYCRYSSVDKKCQIWYMKLEVIPCHLYTDSDRDQSTYQSLLMGKGALEPHKHCLVSSSYRDIRYPSGNELQQPPKSLLLHSHTWYLLVPIFPESLVSICRTCLEPLHKALCGMPRRN